MKVLVANQQEVTQLLPMDEAIGIMEMVLRALAAGDALLPLRSALKLPGEERLMALMPSYLGGMEALGVKVITYFPSNHGTEYDSHQGVVLYFDSERGLLRAIVSGTAVTAIRTAAVSAVATRLLACQGAGDLAIIGAGTQARTHLEAMRAVRRLRRVRVYSLSMARAQAFAERESGRHGIRVEVMNSAERAVAGADLICTATTAREPVLHGSWISPGAHINAVGACAPAYRELDTAAVVRSRLYVDQRHAALNEAGDFLIARAEGAIGDGHIEGEIGELLLGKAAGRRSETEVTLFKSLGLAVEDLAAAHYIYGQAQERGVGTWVEMGGEHFGNA